jgi:hypothetical protein
MPKAPPTSVSSWLLVVATLPTEVPAVRMRVLRTFETLGAAVMRDGVFLLPDNPANLQAVERLVEYITTNAGNAQAVKAEPLDAAQYEAFRKLFDRSTRYDELTKTIESLSVGFGIADPSAISRVLHNQRREFDSIAALDFFPTPARERAQAALIGAENEVRNLMFPAQVAQGVRTSERFLGRHWATRRPVWADRLACSWLIRRFIDPEATIAWLEKSDECPPDAVGFGFEGARFANSEKRITFEEILAQLDMEKNAALTKIGSIVRFLEVRSGTPVPEAAGVQTLLQGALRRSTSDDELLGEAEKTFDLLYEAYCEPLRK